MLLGLPLLAAVTLASQAPGPPPRQPSDPPPLTPPAPPIRATATRAAQPPVIDGRDDDGVWREAQPIVGFQEWRPSEGGPPKLPPQPKNAHTAANLSTSVRPLSPHPDSI